MPLKTPLNYLRHRRDQNYVQKPTTHAKFASYSYINPQINSSLFSQIPGEVRHLIYEFALLASPDLSRPYSKRSWHYRPGYTHVSFININLLLTCRRVYLEADQLAVSQNEHLIYNPIKHGPPGHIPYLLNSPKYRSLLKRSQREQIQQVHIFTQQLWLEDWTLQWREYCMSWQDCNFGIGPNNDEHPERLKITIRHTDWWYYLLGENSPLALDPKFEGRAPPRTWIPRDAPFMANSWGSRFKLLKGLRVFELELETLQEKKEELDNVIEQALEWKFPLPEDRVLVCDCGATIYNSWTGSKYFQWAQNNTTAGAKQGLQNTQQARNGSESSSSEPAPRPLPSRRNSIAMFTRSKTKRNGSRLELSKDSSPPLQEEEEHEEEELTPEEKLDYYVVTLTFRAQDEKEEEEDNIEGGAAPTPQLQTTVGRIDNLPAPWVPRRSGFPTAYG